MGTYNLIDRSMYHIFTSDHSWLHHDYTRSQNLTQDHGIPTLSPTQVFTSGHSGPYPKVGGVLLLPSEDDDLDHLLKGGKNIYDKDDGY